jgi:hypothetical protein
VFGDALENAPSLVETATGEHEVKHALPVARPLL